MEIKIKLITYVICSFIIVKSLSFEFPKRMDIVYRWKYIDYDWPTFTDKQMAINSSRYVPNQILPMDVDVFKDIRRGTRVFITINGAPGVPASLGVVTNKMGPSGPLIAPYPDWSWFKPNDCNSIIGVVRIAIDECNRLYVLDTGYLNKVQLQLRCEAKLLVFDLNTDTLIDRIIIPDIIARNKDDQQTLLNVVVETSAYRCHDITIYMAEASGNGLVVWNNGFLFRLEHPLFKNGTASTLSSGDLSLNLSNGNELGLYGLDISPRIFPNEPRYLYFHSLTSLDLYFIDTREIRSIYTLEEIGKKLHVFGAQKVFTSNALALAFSHDGTMFVGMTKEFGVFCWNRYQELRLRNFDVVAQDYLTLNYANGLKVIPPVHYNMDEELWVFSNKLVTFQNNALDLNDFNYHVLMKPVRQLVSGTRCRMPLKLKKYLQLLQSKHINYN